MKKLVRIDNGKKPVPKHNHSYLMGLQDQLLCLQKELVEANFSPLTDDGHSQQLLHKIKHLREELNVLLKDQ